MRTLYFIPGEVYSSKNSRRVFASGVNVASEAVYRWKSQSQGDWLINKPDFLAAIQHRSRPLLLGLHFVRKTRGKYDWINMVQCIQDMMQEMGYVSDDDVTQVIPMPLPLRGQYSSYEKEKPGVYIALLDGPEQIGTFLDEYDSQIPLLGPRANEPQKPTKPRKSTRMVPLRA